MEIAFPPAAWGSCPALGCHSPALCRGHGGCGAQGRHTQGFIAFPEPPARPVGTLLLTQQETFGTVTPRTKICSRPMGKVIHSWTPQKVSHRDIGLNRIVNTIQQQFKVSYSSAERVSLLSFPPVGSLLCPLSLISWGNK